MMTARRSLPALVLLVIASCTCQSDVAPKKDTGKLAKADPKADPKAAPQPAAKIEAKTGPTFDANTPTAPTTANPTEEKAAPPTDPADPLGRKFADPGWFRKDMLEGAKAMDVSRSERNAEGLFSSQILFELPAGTSVESCADQVEKKVGEEVKNLARTSDEKQPGRIKITGETERYRVTMMCGEAKGVMRAYVSYEWMS
ncbi:MAG TPA: hypothetical protein VG755_03885 [Nannocystaceae bacterium]|nr:hypothetical protein [Nannocystaceae bacterium]